jgi:hypothetical protein
VTTLAGAVGTFFWAEKTKNLKFFCFYEKSDFCSRLKQIDGMPEEKENS